MSVPKLGRRVPWYIFGNLIVLVSLVCVFIYPQKINQVDFQGYFMNQREQIFWYLPWICGVGVGYGMVNAAHLTALPELSLYEGTKENLAHKVEGYEKVSHVLVLSLSLILWTYVPSQVN